MCNSYTEATTMNFNIYLDDETGQQLNQLAKQSGGVPGPAERLAVGLRAGKCVVRVGFVA